MAMQMRDALCLAVAARHVLLANEKANRLDLRLSCMARCSHIASRMSSGNCSIKARLAVGREGGVGGEDVIGGEDAIDAAGCAIVESGSGAGLGYTLQKSHKKWLPAS